MKKHKHVKRTKATKKKISFRFSKISWWMIGGVIILLVIFFISFAQQTVSVKGVSTSQTQQTQQERGGFFQSFFSWFSSVFGGDSQIERPGGVNDPFSSDSQTTTASQESDSTATTTGTGSTGDISALPLGDKKYVTSPKVGYIYSCQTSFTGGGAFTAGPWIDQSAGTWDLTKKLEVDGNVDWPTANVTFTFSGSNRVISGNALPDHTTGVYPISSSDDVYQYDRNPNSIKSGTISLTLPANPTVLTTPECSGGSVGIMLSGVPIFNGFDAGGRDAVAWEVQDSCEGHPQSAGQYHYHGPSSCVTDTALSDGHSGLIGYALDGFGIFGVKGEGGKQVWTEDLDECHGHTHSISWDGSTKSMFHYHMTYDFPYSVSCFRGKKAARTVGASEGQGGSGMQGQSGKRTGSGSTQGGTPPQAAITACSGKSSGTSCSFTSPNGTVSGTCQTPPGQSSVACVPSNR